MFNKKRKQLMRRATSTAAGMLGGKLASTMWKAGGGKAKSSAARSIGEAAGFAALSSAAVAGLNVAFSRYIETKERGFANDVQLRRKELNSELDKKFNKKS